MTAYSIESYQSKFLNQYRIIFSELKAIIKEQNLSETTERQIDSFIIQFLNRIMFIYFIQSERIFPDSKNFLKTLIKTFIDKIGGNIYEGCLLSLFYYNSNQEKTKDYSIKMDTLLSRYGLFSYFNRNLFTKTNLDRLGITIPNDFIKKVIFEFFEQYNYSIFEGTTRDKDKSKINPDMLGKTYESMMTEDVRYRRGIFYTPKEEVELMCKIALIQLIENEKLLSKKEAILLLFEKKDQIIENEEYINDITNNKENWHFKQKETSLLNYIRNLKVVDPSCGTGVFLIEMANILLKLRKTLGDKRKRTIELKSEILCNNIYGVDIQNLAINMCKLRLWLWFIAESREKSNKNIDCSFSLFPDLDLNLKVGDSLLASIFNREIKKKGIEKLFKKEEYKKLKDLIKLKVKLKEQYFRGEIGIKSRIIQLENLILRKFSEITTINQNQKDFLWEIAFIEIFELNGGFDIVIGNPPYVRQEEITLPHDKKDLKREKKKLYKNQIIAQMDDYWGSEHLKTRRNDYFVYFYYLSLHILRLKGVNVFITSNAWLDNQYGIKLQEFLLKNSFLCYIIQNEAERSFTAAINTTITVLTFHSFQEKKLQDLDFKTSFITILKPLKTILSDLNTIMALFTVAKDFTTEIYRIRLRKSRDLWNMAQISLNINGKDRYFIGGRYQSVKWGGVLLKAPDIYFKILDSFKRFPKLGDLADVHRGITSNANEFFYIPNKYFQIKNQDQNYFFLESRKNPLFVLKIEKKYTRPLFKSAQESQRINIELDNLSRYVIIIPYNVDIQKYQIGSYINWGKKFGFPEYPALRSRKPWFILNVTEPPFLFWIKSYYKRFLCFENSSDILADQRFYVIYIPKEEVNIRRNVTLFLNSSISAFITEIEGIKNLGEGLLDTNVYWLKNVHIPLIKDWKCNKTIETLDSYDLMRLRPIKSVYEELGVKDPFNTKKDLSFDEILPKDDRFSIDSLFASILGLTKDELYQIYYHLLTLVTNRLRKSGTK